MSLFILYPKISLTYLLDDNIIIWFIMKKSGLLRPLYNHILALNFNNTWRVRLQEFCLVAHRLFSI